MQRGGGLLHNPEAVHSADCDPVRRYPELQVNETDDSKKKSLPVLSPLAGMPGSPQLIAEIEIKRTHMRQINKDVNMNLTNNCKI